MNDRFLLFEEVVEKDSSHHHDVRYALFKEHISKTVAAAKALHVRLPDGTMYEDQDFIVIGLEALWQCTENYDPSVNPNFWGYARSRVTGSMIDEIRSSDPVSRSNRDTLKKIERQRQTLQQTFQREATFEEACSTLGIDHEKSGELSGISAIGFVSLNSSPFSNGSRDSETTLAEIIADPNSIDPIAFMDRDRDILELEKLLGKLQPIERSVIRLYFFSGLRLNDIASGIGVTESRVSQLLSDALQKLREFAMKGEEVFSRHSK
ncbi:MAG: sigma-70 family RNA polymerase sigma factor [Patescibacteria group bacterium]